MFCSMCGRELSDDSTFCSYCGTAVKDKPVEDALSDEGDDAEKCSPICPPVAADEGEGVPVDLPTDADDMGDAKGDASSDDVPPEGSASKAARRPLHPAFIVCASTCVTLALIAGCYAAYTFVLSPAPTQEEQVAETDDGTAEGVEEDSEAAADEQEASSEEDAEAGEAAAVEETPAEEQALAPAHDFECEYFYIDVPDEWIADGSWSIEGPMYLPAGEGALCYDCGHSDPGTSAIGGNSFSGAALIAIDSSVGATAYVGTTSTGHEIWVSLAGGGVFGNASTYNPDIGYSVFTDGTPDTSYAVITLK